MSDQRLTKKQHYVPRMYLKRWLCENDKKLLVITKKAQNNNVQAVSVDNELFYQDYCYDIPNPDGTLWTSNEVEKAFGQYEKRHNKLLDRILNRCEEDVPILDKGTNRIEDFLEFVALMVVRNPNNNIPFNFDDIQFSTTELNDLFQETFGNKWSITGLQVVANSMEKRLLFDTAKQVNQTDNLPEVYFLRSTDGSYFITSDNPVLCNEKWSYIPLSPRYAAFILYDTRINFRFKQNRVFQLSSEEAQKFNSLYWSQDDTYTIIGNRESDLIDSLDIEVKA